MNQRNVVVVEQAFQSKVNLADKERSSSGKAPSPGKGDKTGGFKNKNFDHPTSENRRYEKSKIKCFVKSMGIIDQSVKVVRKFWPC